jgi:hypothetical protein
MQLESRREPLRAFGSTEEVDELEQRLARFKEELNLPVTRYSEIQLYLGVLSVMDWHCFIIRMAFL